MHCSELTAAHLWKPAAWLQVAGPDALNYLQGQFTNDLRILENQPAVYGLWLDEKGRVLADSFILRGEAGSFWVGSYFSLAGQLCEHIKANLVSDDATVEDCTETCAGLSLTGAEAQSMAEKFGGALQFAGRRTSFPSVELIFSAESRPTVEARVSELNLPELPA
ncbi:MAG: hypothetical protein ABSE59_07705, partial [Opitutaceae bacterium]